MIHLPALRLALLVCLCAGLTACGALPRGAALQREIVTTNNTADPQIAVYPITRAYLPAIAARPSTAPVQPGWIRQKPGSAAQIIRPGDTLNVHIWDTADNALLSAPDQRGAALPPVRVGGDGMIFLPYIGRINVTTRTPEAARSLIQRKLEEVVPSVQVQLAMSEGRHNTVDLVSGFRTPGPVILPDQSFTVLSAVTAGGGADPALVHPQVRLLRGNKAYVTSLRKLYENPHLDTRLRGGDKLLLESDPRSFIALGAAGREARIPFDREHLTALDAIAMMGGIEEGRADPAGVLILREYPEHALRTDDSGPDLSRAVFTLDLTGSDGLFSARHFMIMPGDLVLATESPVTDTRTVLGLAGAAFGLALSANRASN